MAMLPPAAFADRAFWGCAYGEPQVLRSGPIACRQEVRQCKNMILSCSRGAESLFTVSDFADYIAASADGRYVVGLSNRGSENAFWIRDSYGKVIERKTHHFELGTELLLRTFGLHHWWGIHYCEASVTNVRVRFDKADPAVKFQFMDRKLMQVLVRAATEKVFVCCNSTVAR